MTTQRGKSKASIFLPFQVVYLVIKTLLVNSTFIQGEYINIDDALDNVQFPHALIVGFGMDLSSLADPRVYCGEDKCFEQCWKTTNLGLSYYTQHYLNISNSKH